MTAFKTSTWLRLLIYAICLAAFASTFWMLRLRQDPLFRYPYGTSEQRAELSEALDPAEINTLINLQIQPDQVLPYVHCEGYDINSTFYYDQAMQAQKADPAFIVDFINKYKDRLSLSQLSDLLSWMSYSDLIAYFESGTSLALTSNPNTTLPVLHNETTLWTWDPADLVPVAEGIALRQEAADAFLRMQADAAAQGVELTAIQGFAAYEQQAALPRYSSYPRGAYGSWEEQLGTMVQLDGFAQWNEAISAMDPSKIDTQQVWEETLTDTQRAAAQWLEANAWQYGFTVRYPNGQEAMTGTVWQPFVIRYVGEPAASAMHDWNVSLEEYLQTKKEEEA